MSTAHQIESLIGAGLVLIAGALAVPGWVTSRPDSAARFRVRFLSWLALFFGWVLINRDAHGFWGWAVYLLGGTYMLNRVQHWYRATEKARKAEALQPAVSAHAYWASFDQPNRRRGVSGD